MKSEMDLGIIGGTIVLVDRMVKGNLFIKGEKIAALTDQTTVFNCKRTLDATGLYVLAGAVDGHVHFNDPGFTWREDFSHASRAAIMGGTTCVVDMPLQNNPSVVDAQAIAYKKNHLASKSYVDYALWGGLTSENYADYAAQWQAGVAALKAFLAPVSDGFSPVDCHMIDCAFRSVQNKAMLFGFHCEDYGIVFNRTAQKIAEKALTRRDYLKTRPVIAELLATQNVIALAKQYGIKIHICHVSDPAVAQVIKEAKVAGVDVTAETCPHYLVFSEEDYLAEGGAYKCAPPLRSKAASDHLWEYVLDGTLSIIGSDHSPCKLEEKREASNGAFDPWGGISGVQTLLMTMYDFIVNVKRADVSLLSRLISYNPAVRFGLSHAKGSLEVGKDADIVLLDPNGTWQISNENLAYLNKFSAFNGLSGRGLVTATILRGQLVFRDGKLTLFDKTGKWLARQD